MPADKKRKHENSFAESRQDRIENALWGLFLGDALAMPAHWYYNRDNITKQWGPQGVEGLEAPPHPHPESFMVGMSYEPDVETAKKLGRPYDILHQHARFYKTTFAAQEVHSETREESHGNKVPKAEDRYHYHYGLEKGENTTGAQLVRCLLRSVIKNQRYIEEEFTKDFVQHLGTPGPHNSDPYKEVYLRRWFENYSKGLPIDKCAANQRDIWSIGSAGGLVRPMVLSLLAPNPYLAVGAAIDHQQITHRTQNGASALAVLVPLLHDLVDGANPAEAIPAHGNRVHLPKVNGTDMFAMYRSFKGPGNIPKGEMWNLHVELRNEAVDFGTYSQKPEEDVVVKDIGTACYTEHTMPLALYHAAKYPGNAKAALCADVNSGGDSVHRCMVLGLIAGASDQSVHEMAKGLKDYEEIAKEIKEFSALAVGGRSLLAPPGGQSPPI